MTGVDETVHDSMSGGSPRVLDAGGATSASGVPAPQPNWAYFLDFDGTLVSIVPLPHNVTPDDGLPALLQRLSTFAGGAVALISGRAVAEIDTFLAMPELTVVGQHGAERRDAQHDSVGDSPEARPASPPRADRSAAFASARTALEKLVGRFPQLHFEDKGLSLALHYRSAPSFASFAHQTMRSLQRSLGDGYTIQPGKRVVELKVAHHNKGTAIQTLLVEPPFAGRRPVFIGDDVTDEDGFDVVNACGGISVKVGPGRTRATFRLPSVEAVRQWLEQIPRAMSDLRIAKRSL